MRNVIRYYEAVTIANHVDKAMLVGYQQKGKLRAKLEGWVPLRQAELPPQVRRIPTFPSIVSAKRYDVGRNGPVLGRSTKRTEQVCFCCFDVGVVHTEEVDLHAISNLISTCVLEPGQQK